MVTATDAPEALTVIKSTAQENNAALTVITSQHASRISSPALIGEHQRLNAALASATVKLLCPVIPVTETRIQAGLAKVSWPGRFQVVQRPGGRTIVFDGAHNPDGVKTLALALQSNFPNINPTLIVGMLADKNWQLMCDQLASLAGRVVTVPVGSDRSASATDLAAVCRELLPHATEACQSLSEAFSKTESDRLVVVTGSLYLVGEALELLGLFATGSVSERSLNEWTGAPSRKPGDQI